MARLLAEDSEVGRAAGPLTVVKKTASGVLDREPWAASTAKRVRGVRELVQESLATPLGQLARRASDRSRHRVPVGGPLQPGRAAVGVPVSRAKAVAGNRRVERQERQGQAPGDGRRPARHFGDMGHSSRAAWPGATPAPES
jgi:hypothetical protein